MMFTPDSGISGHHLSRTGKNCGNSSVSVIKVINPTDFGLIVATVSDGALPLDHGRYHERS